MGDMEENSHRYREQETEGEIKTGVDIGDLGTLQTAACCLPPLSDNLRPAGRVPT